MQIIISNRCVRYFFCTLITIQFLKILLSLSDKPEAESHIWIITTRSVHQGLWYNSHDDIITWKHLPRYWPFVRGIHRSPVNSPHKGQWRGALIFSFISAWINGWVNNLEADDLRRQCAHYDVTVMVMAYSIQMLCWSVSSQAVICNHKS